MVDRFDLVTIGGGTAALVASFGVAAIGGRAALIEAERPGGDCLWTGCVPSKALIAAAAAAHTIRTADRYGLDSTTLSVDLGRVMKTVVAARATIEPHDSPERLSAEGVEVLTGHGRFVGPGRIRVGDRTLGFRAALIASGARPVLPPVPGLVDCGPLTSDTIWDLDELPDRLVVLGGGPIGCELGQAFARLGSTVTIVEALETLLPREAAGVGELLARRFRDEGIEVRTGARGDSVSVDGSGFELTLVDGSRVGFDKVLVALGRRPSTSDLGLETVGVEVDEHGSVVVDDLMRTTGDRIYAAGDVTGKMPYTHVAAYQARLVVTNAMLRTRRSADYDKIPWVTFTDPEIARVGLDAEAARRRWGGAAVVQRFDYAGLDRAVTSGDPVGWAELVGDPKRRLVGATVVGEAAGESIAELVAWMATGRRIDDVSTTVHAYPTFSEGPGRAADELMRARFLGPRITRLTRPLLRLLRRIDAPRGS